MASCALRTSNSMFDWPEHRKTSPTTTSRAVTCPLSLRADNAIGPALVSAANPAWNRPCASAVTTWVAAPNVIVIISPGSALPRIRAGRSRWITEWSPDSASNTGAAAAGIAVTGRNPIATAMIYRFERFICDPPAMQIMPFRPCRTSEQRRLEAPIRPLMLTLPFRAVIFIRLTT